MPKITQCWQILGLNLIASTKISAETTCGSTMLRFSNARDYGGLKLDSVYQGRPITNRRHSDSNCSLCRTHGLSYGYPLRSDQGTKLSLAFSDNHCKYRINPATGFTAQLSDFRMLCMITISLTHLFHCTVLSIWCGFSNENTLWALAL